MFFIFSQLILHQNNLDNFIEQIAMQDKPEIYYHVGLPKTATTFLQHEVFPKFRGIHFVKKHDFKHHDKIIQKHRQSKVLFSVEHDWDFEQALSSFAEKYPHARIIIAFRRHDKWLSSKYRYYIRKSGFKRFEEYFDLENDLGVLTKEDLRFMNYIRIIEKYFHEKPLVIFQDELKEDFYGVLDHLAGFMGASYDRNRIKPKVIKKAFNDKQLFYLRKFNRTFKHHPKKFKKRIWRRSHIMTRKYVVHTFAFFVNFIPKTMTPDFVLLPPEALEKVREYYKQDWEACQKYARNITP